MAAAEEWVSMMVSGVDEGGGWFGDDVPGTH
jgi:hypothetical protein